MVLMIKQKGQVFLFMQSKANYMKQKILILAILFLGFILRMWGNNFGLPDMLVHSDENEYVSVVKSLVDYTPSPYKIGIPKSSFYYLLGSHYSFFRNFIHNSPVIEDYFLSGRSFSAILSTIVLFLWFLTVRNFFNFRLAIWSMLFLAVSLIDVQIAHYIKEDVYVQFFGVISLYFLSRSFRNGGFWNLVVSIIAAVLAGSAKISGFVYAIPIGLHLILFNEDKRALNIKNFVHFNKNRILVFFLITLASLAFYINTPISFMDSPASKKYSLDALLSPEHEVLVMSSNKDGLMNVVFWPVYLLTTGMGYFLFPMSVLGIGVLFKKRRLYAVKFASIWIMTALYYFILSVQTQRFDRWITLITPSLALLGAIAIEWLLTKFSKRFITCIVSIGLIWTIGLIGTLDWKLSQPDTRHFAVEQLKKLNENDILLFLPGLDPVKNEMAKSGSIVYDLDCPPAGAHRYAGMYFVKIFRDQHNIFACSGILYNHESPRRDYCFLSRKITSTAVKIKLGFEKELRLGDLEARQDWGFAGDYVEAMWRILQADKPKDYVIGTGISYSVKDILHMAFSPLGLHWEDYVVVDKELMRKNENHGIVADISRIRDELGWQPITAIEEVIGMMVNEDLRNIKRNQ